MKTAVSVIENTIEDVMRDTPTLSVRLSVTSVPAVENVYILTLGVIKFDVTVFETNAVVAICCVDVPSVAVGAVGMPVNAVFVSDKLAPVGAKPYETDFVVLS